MRERSVTSLPGLMGEGQDVFLIIQFSFPEKEAATTLMPCPILRMCQENQLVNTLC